MYAWPAYQAMPGDLTAEMEQLLRWASWVISLPVVLFACGPFFSSALRDIRQRRVSMDLPVALGMLITFVVSMIGTFDPTGPFGREVYYDSLTMFVFFLLTGRWLELRLREPHGRRARGRDEPAARQRRAPHRGGRFRARGHAAAAGGRRGAGAARRGLPGRWAHPWPAARRPTRPLLTGESTPCGQVAGQHGHGGQP
ncbi:heavy metal translocating p-type ATPase [Alicycliphilus sp. B1]|nr:heavy metal translocating p-type ATPase [Alicycliphilus sp. B1]